MIITVFCQGLNRTIVATKKRKSGRPTLQRRLTAARRVLPRVVCVGAMRCGTTTLVKQLKTHPDYVPAMRKEIHFFDKTRKQQLNGRDYRGFFPTRAEMARHSEKAFTADITPSYMLFPQVPPYMARLLPEAKVLVLMRNPARRAVSHYYKRNRTRGREGSAAGLNKFVLEELRLAEARPGYKAKFSHSLARGRYLEQILRFEAVFPREHLMYVASENMNREQQIWMDRIADFYEIPRWQIDPSQRSPQHAYEEPYPETIELLDDYFAPHNQALFEHLGVEFPWH